MNNARLSSRINDSESKHKKIAEYLWSIVYKDKYLTIHKFSTILEFIDTETAEA